MVFGTHYVSSPLSLWVRRVFICSSALASPQKGLSLHHATDDFQSEVVALSGQVTRSENMFCFPGTFFPHANLQSLRLYPFTDGWHPFVVAAEAIYLLFLLYYMIVQVRGGL